MSSAAPEEPTENTPSEEQDQTSNRIIDRTRDTWRHIVIWLLASALIGLTGVGVAIASDYANEANLWLQEKLHWWLLVLVPAAFALFAWLTNRFFQGTQGSGIPQTIAVIDDPDDRKKSNLLSVRNLLGKIAMLLSGLVVGASIGREGPTVQIGASISHAFYGYGPFKTAEHRRTLVLAGGAAGIAAAFNTPLAGVMFAIEELNKKYPFNAHSSTLLTVIIAGLISLGIQGNYTYFGKTNVILDLSQHVYAIFLCGIVGGAAGGLFSLLTQKFTFLVPERLRTFIYQSPYVFAAICGLLVAILGLATNGLTFGTSYLPTRMTLEADGSLFVWYYGICKFFATLLSTLSGIPGGLFAPTLSVGAGLGDTLSAILPAIAPHGAIIILVMVAYLSGVTRSPLTSFIITMEMTGSNHMLLSLMITALIASGVSRFISPVPLYHALAQRYAYPASPKKKRTTSSPDDPAGES
ncbi:chloride channel protein [Oxalobacter sp. OttesenSCG-928-P03]|nr:chloride channel protein [Oxalobacter sp. OttesenSCG-928-P03]